MIPYMSTIDRRRWSATAREEHDERLYGRDDSEREADCVTKGQDETR